ncbi:hypothetical protein B296_00008818 [Ensete ventricosum]|uniref:Uncharacterized protein n=1 Tax=Ensete ventricosum TaxID=4639 RepID=A0A427B7L3_ENSVE|nr:hypothetical protein B296_00008818 [Ensete ventricosum]
MLSYEFFEATQFRKNKEDQIRCGSRPEWKGEPRRENDTHGGEPAFKSIGDGGGGADEGAVADRRPQIGEVAGWRRRGERRTGARVNLQPPRGGFRGSVRTRYYRASAGPARFPHPLGKVRKWVQYGVASCGICGRPNVMVFAVRRG